MSDNKSHSDTLSVTLNICWACCFKIFTSV